MKTVYIDSDFKVHTKNDGTRRAVITDVFDNKCQEWIEGHRLVPAGETWIREDGEIFQGSMCTAWKPYAELDAAQRKFERQMLAEYQAEITELRENSIPAAELFAAYQEGVNSV